MRILITTLFCLVTQLFFFNSEALAAGEYQALNNKLQELIILDAGRYKPFDTYAQNKLLQFSGKSKIKAKDQNLDAYEWLSMVVFQPEQVENAKLFLINHPQIPEALEIEIDHKRHYSYAQLRDHIDSIDKFANSAMQKEESSRTIVDQEFIRIFSNFHNYNQISNSMALFQSKSSLKFFSQGQIAKELNISPSPSIYELSLKAKDIERLIESPSKELNDSALKLGFALFSWIESYREYLNTYNSEEVFAFIASPETHINPWTYFFALQNKVEKYNAENIETVFELQKSYDSQNLEKFTSIIDTLNKKSKDLIQEKKLTQPKISLELFYNNFSPLSKAKLLYLLSFILALLAFASNKKETILHKVSSGAMLIASILHFSAVLSRIIILERAPVSNLYETFVFVALIISILGVIIQRINKKYIFGNLSASLSSFILLIIASKYASDGDTMKVLIAVLDSNFWLSTHVVSEMIGYAGVSLAGLLGHLYIFKKLKYLNNQSPEQEQELNFLNKSILGMIAFGLLFTFLGTMLGGVWADQSWGRFWGWDPKENGALLIILWTAIPLHSRIAGYIKDFGLAIFAIIGTVVVMVSWFGVNLLGVGLHSYGFTQGLAMNLLSYILFELIFILASMFIYQRITKKIS